MRFVIYKNSVLATFCSMFGAAFIAMAVMSMISGELGILPGIGVIAAGLGFMWLGDFISTKKSGTETEKDAADCCHQCLGFRGRLCAATADRPLGVFCSLFYSLWVACCSHRAGQVCEQERHLCRSILPAGRFVGVLGL